ncbi:hypothetical protein ACFLQ2_03590 [archaeon]
MRFAGLMALLLLLGVALACDAAIGNVVIGSSPNCPQGVAPGEAEVYKGEEFYVCGNAYLTGELVVAGEVWGKEPQLMDANSQVVNGWFSLLGSADVTGHKYHYINVSLQQPCEKELESIALEIKDSCVMLPPSTIEAVPDIITVGQEFTLQVKNPDREMEMRVTGLASQVNTGITSGWSQTFSSSDCSPLGPCIIHFEFTDSQHEICVASADVVVTVRALPEEPPAEEEDSTLLFVTLGVLILGTAGAVLLNRYL